MAINKVQIGETFRNWLDITNEVVDDINGATDSGLPNKLVRYDANGGITLASFGSNTISLLRGVTIDGIFDDTTNIDATSVLTSTATQSLIESYQHQINDATGVTSVIASASDLQFDVNSISLATFTDSSITFTANTNFDQNVHISGKLTVDGDSVSIATTELTVEDHVVTLNKGNLSGIDGAGFEIEGGASSIVASFTYNQAASGFDIKTGLNTLTVVPLVDLTLELNQNLSTASAVLFESVQANTAILVPTLPVQPPSAGAGQIYFDLVESTFKGFDGNDWGSLGGVITPDQNTYVKALNISNSIEVQANNNNVMNIFEDSVEFTANVASVDLFGKILDGIEDVLTASTTKIPTSDAVSQAIASVSGDLANLDQSKINTDNTSVETTTTAVALNVENVNLINFTNGNVDFTASVVGVDLFGKSLDGIENAVDTLSSSDTKIPTSNAVFQAISAVSGDLASLNLTKIENGSTNVQANPTNIEFTTGGNNVTTDVLVGGIFHIPDLSTTASFRVPVLTSDPAEVGEGWVIYNTTESTFKGFDGTAWGSLGGVITIDQNTFIKALDVSNSIEFQANSKNVMNIFEDGVEFTANVASVDLFGKILDGIDNAVDTLSSTDTKIPTSKAVKDQFDAVSTLTASYSKILNGTTSVETSPTQIDLNVSGSPLLVANTTSVVITGDLIVTGTETKINTADLNVQDKLVTLNVGGDGTSAQGAGVEIAAASSSIVLSNDLNAFVLTGQDTTARIENDVQFAVRSNGVETLTSTNANFVINAGGSDVMILDSGVADFSGTANAVFLPTSSIATGLPAHLRYNDTTDHFEGYTTTGWKTLNGVLDIDQDTSIVAHPTNNVITTSANGNVIGTQDETGFHFTTNDTTANVAKIETTSTPVATLSIEATDGANTVNNSITPTLFNLSTGLTEFAANNEISQIIAKTTDSVVPTTFSSVTIDPNTVDILAANTGLLSVSATNVAVSTDMSVDGVTTLGTGQGTVGTTTGALVVNGGVGIAQDLFVGNSITELSAKSLKTNIKPISNALNKVLQLKGVEYNWINKENDQSEFGLIAEEVADVAPNLVSFQNDMAQGVKYSKMVSLLIEAIKEQNEEIQRLKDIVNNV